MVYQSIYCHGIPVNIICRLNNNTTYPNLLFPDLKHVHILTDWLSSWYIIFLATQLNISLYCHGIRVTFMCILNYHTTCTKHLFPDLTHVHSLKYWPNSLYIILVLPGYSAEYITTLSWYSIQWYMKIY